VKFLIVSDSHGLTDELKDVVRRHRDEADVCFHCGDSELAADAPEMAAFIGVKGNCDAFDAGYPNERIHDLGGAKLLITHGHLYRVDGGLMNLYYKAEESGCGIVCFGHTHVAGSAQQGDVVFINPGSLRLPRGRRTRSYALAEWREPERRLTVRFYTDAGDPILDLSAEYRL